VLRTVVIHKANVSVSKYLEASRLLQATLLFASVEQNIILAKMLELEKTSPSSPVKKAAVKKVAKKAVKKAAVKKVAKKAVKKAAVKKVAKKAAKKK
jgi:hypothetical protein